MKVGPIPENFTENLAMRMGKVPTPLIDVLFGPMKARAIMAGVRLGIFESLMDAPATAADLAKSLRLDESCLEILLRVLVHCDYLEWDGSRFSLSKLCRRTLVPGAPMDRSGYVEWNFTQWKILEHLEDLLRSGAGLDLHETMQDASAWAFYQRGMMENARDHADYVAENVPVADDAQFLIDLGGSHGLLGAAICRRHPPMRSVVFDLEAALAVAQELAQREKIEDVVSHRALNILTEDLGSGHDVALLANILHHFSPEQCLALLNKVRQALKKNGTVAIWEFESPRRDSKITGGDAVALLFRLTSSARAYHADEYSAWLKEAGFQKIVVYRPLLLPGYILVTAQV